jgi:hypothetical protein
LILGFYLAATVPFVSALVTVARGRLRIWTFCAALVCLFGLIVTYTRSGYLGAALGAVVALALAIRNPRIRMSVIGIVLIVGGSLLVNAIHHGNQTLVRSGETQSKKDALGRDFDIIVARPLGYGLGTIDAVAQRFQLKGGNASESTLFAKGIEGGVLILFLYPTTLFVMSVAVLRARARSLRLGRRTDAALAAGAVGVILAIAAADLFLGVQELAVEIALWGAIGLTLAMIDNSSRASQKTD